MTLAKSKRTANAEMRHSILLIASQVYPTIPLQSLPPSDSAIQCWCPSAASGMVPVILWNTLKPQKADDYFSWEASFEENEGLPSNSSCSFCQSSHHAGEAQEAEYHFRNWTMKFTCWGFYLTKLSILALDKKAVSKQPKQYKYLMAPLLGTLVHLLVHVNS